MRAIGLPLHDPPFEQWVQHLFDHPVTDPAWHWDPYTEQAELNARLAVAHLTRLFEESGALSAAYSDAQLNQGLWYLGSTAASGTLFALYDASVALDERVACIRSMERMFEKLFLQRCTPHLSHSDEPGASTLNSICYMWWDVIPLYGQPNDPVRGQVDPACLEVMEATLALPSIACQESALHGLGHWALYYPERCSEAVNAFIASHPQIRSDLLEYAKCARAGMVL